jgi:hypothetical protein
MFQLAKNCSISPQGKYSTNMGMNGVWENVYRLGLFRSSTQFYAIWAEHWATQGQWANFDKTVALCEQHCHLGPAESQHLFGFVIYNNLLICANIIR